MTQDHKDTRRKALRQEEPLFRIQAPYLRRLGGTKAATTDDDKTADELRDLDLLVWDETEHYLSCFASDLSDAPDLVTDLLPKTAQLGRQLGMEVELPPLVAALTFIRILAGGDDVYAKYKYLCFAIMSSQDNDPRYKPLFEKYCQEIEDNKYDPRNHEEVNYRRGDPMERLKDTEEAKAEARIEELLGQILEATRGWNSKDAFGDYWEQWTELWVYLLKQEEMTENVSQKHPGSRANNTEINITLVCNVAGLMKRHLEKILKRASLPDTSFADLIEEAWKADSRRKEVSKITEIKEQASLIKGWLARNVK